MNAEGFFQYSHLYYIQNDIKVIENDLKQNPERVCELLKNLQITTRYLHRLCCHSKVNQIRFFRLTFFINNFVTFSTFHIAYTHKRTHSDISFATTNVEIFTVQTQY